MLPLSITKHPFFHQDYDEIEAKIFLSNTTNKANLLFCKTQNIREFLLCYKASFRGNIEIRVLKLTYNVDQKKIENSNLESSSTLYAISHQLPKFLSGIIDGQFHPIPACKTSAIKEIFLAQSDILTPPFEPISNDVIGNVFSKLGLKSLFNTMQVSKSCYLIIHSNIISILKIRDQEEKIQIDRERECSKFLFDFILRKKS